jgi:hypothetical protein
MYNPLVGPAPAFVTTNDRPSGAAFDASADRIVIDGTPVRVVMLVATASLVVLALRWSGFRFNVGVSS